MKKLKTTIQWFKKNELNLYLSKKSNYTIEIAFVFFKYIYVNMWNMCTEEKSGKLHEKIQ